MENDQVFYLKPNTEYFKTKKKENNQLKNIYEKVHPYET